MKNSIQKYCFIVVLFISMLGVPSIYHANASLTWMDIYNPLGTPPETVAEYAYQQFLNMSDENVYKQKILKGEVVTFPYATGYSSQLSLVQNTIGKPVIQLIVAAYTPIGATTKTYIIDLEASRVYSVKYKDSDEKLKANVLPIKDVKTKLW